MTVILADLAASILAAERASRWASPPVLALADDPFRLDLPSFPPPVGDQIDGPTMELMGGLYLIAELEQTGMLRAAELLTDQRMSLDVRSGEAVELLEEVAQAAREWYREEERNLLYARVFGLGAAANRSPAPNSSFEATLLEMCTAVVDWSDSAWFRRPPAARHEVVVAAAARALRANLAPRQHGNTRTAARRLADQVGLSHRLLTHEGIIALTAGRTMWDVVRGLWGDEPPDIARLVALGQSGQQVIGWAGSQLAERGEPTNTAVDAAASWLQAAHDDGAAA